MAQPPAVHHPGHTKAQIRLIQQLASTSAERTINPRDLSQNQELEAFPANDPLQIEPLAAWHLPLLGDPAFVPLQPQLQRAVLLGPPGRLLQWLRRRPGLPCQILIARQGQRALGLLLARQTNRSGSCWQVHHLRLACSSSRRLLSKLLVAEAIRRERFASSWIATSSSLDQDRLAALREQGFQPLLNERLWRWHVDEDWPDTSSGELNLRVLNHRTSLAMLHLEQAACPLSLRRLLDRCSDDLIDQSRGRGWMLFDPSRNQAVAGVRWLGEHPGGGHDLELTVHPGWERLIGSDTLRLLLQARQALGCHQPLWLRSDVSHSLLEHWLQRIGAEERGQRVLMARSVWRRQAQQDPSLQAARGLGAMLEQLQPRRRPMPTPLTPR